jgi:hypothetical protein
MSDLARRRFQHLDDQAKIASTKGVAPNRTPLMVTHRPNPDLYGLPIEDRLQFAAGIEHLCSLGPRILTSFLLEACDDPIPDLIRRLEDYRRLTPEGATALQAGGWTRPTEVAIRRWRAA